MEVQKWIDFIAGNTLTVGLHMRFGNMEWLGMLRMPRLSWYKMLFANFQKQTTFIIISDDIPKATKYLETIKNKNKHKFITSPFKDLEHDFALLTLCDIPVSSRGTFSWWAIYLNGLGIHYAAEFNLLTAFLHNPHSDLDYYPPFSTSLISKASIMNLQEKARKRRKERLLKEKMMVVSTNYDNNVALMADDATTTTTTNKKHVEVVKNKPKVSSSLESTTAAVVYNKIVKSKKIKTLKSVLVKTCKRWRSQFDTDFHHKKLKSIFNFMKYHKIHYTLSDGSLLAYQRFHLFASPWDDDIDITAPMDEIERIFAVENVAGKYKDVTRTRYGKSIYNQYCKSRVHLSTCFKVRVIALEETAMINRDGSGTPDCISFEALNWGFLHVRYHVKCKPRGQHCFDAFVHYKCMDDESQHCKQASIDYKQYLHKLQNIKPANRYLPGIIRPAWFDILMESDHHNFQKVIVSGVETYVPEEVQIVKYLNGIYPGWDKTLLICPHNLFNDFGHCNKRKGHDRPEYSYQDAIGVMKEINDCKAILDLGSSSKVITSDSSVANVEQENTAAVVKNDTSKHLTTSKKTLLDYMKRQAFD